MVRSCLGPVVNLRSPGIWLFTGSLLMLLMVNLAEFLYPDYSVSKNYISDLGVGPMPSRGIFIAALIIFGLMAIMSSVFMRRSHPDSSIWLLLATSGIGAIGVGLFDENSARGVHGAFAAMAFLSGNFAALWSAKLVHSALKYIFVPLGLLGIAALVLFGLKADLGLGLGGMERMVFYPAMIWSLAYGAYLSGVEGSQDPSL